jgi:thiamine biosynthesis lipoprotein ApbE
VSSISVFQALNLNGVFNHMNTTFRFMVHCERRRVHCAQETLRQAHAMVSRLESSLSEFLPGSPVYQLNHSPMDTPINALPELFEILNLGSVAEDFSGRAFNVLAKSEEENPKISWDENSITRRTPKAHLSFGAIGKGFALDKVRTLLFQEGFSDFFLSAGGSSLVLEGFASGGAPWTFGWSWDSETGIPFSHCTGKTVAIGVSGLHEKGLHIVDPLQLAKARSALSALVATSSAALADAYSTALFVMGSEGFQKIPDAALGLIDGDGVPHWNSAFQNLWGGIPCQK